MNDYQCIDLMFASFQLLFFSDNKKGKNCLIGANSLVTEGKHIPDGSLVMGSPAKVVKSLTEKQIEGIKKTSRNYVERSKYYRELGI